MSTNIPEVALMTTKRIITPLVAVVLLAATPMVVADEPVQTFRGSSNDYNLGFSVDGHWELHWKTEGNKDFPSFSQFEVRLEDAITGRFLGVVAQKTGSGQGVRYITDGGRFFVNVLAKNVRWKIDIVDVKEPWAKVPELQGTEEEYRMNVIVTDKNDAAKSPIPKREGNEKPRQ